jgi:antitoxin (DNA-binding transcriptional repressor) of toxin-antitoxin stability system
VVIARAGKPIARLSALERGEGVRVLGRDAGLFSVPEDFDAPLAEEVLAEFER